MAKRKKKRNKVYTGSEAAPKQPTVHRYEAVTRSPFGEWWQEKKRTVKIVSIITGVVAFIIVIISGIVQLFS